MGELDIYDGLDSNDPFVALSANQGRILNEKVTNIATDSDIIALFA